jgi:hypothetical protein
VPSYSWSANSRGGLVLVDESAEEVATLDAIGRIQAESDRGHWAGRARARGVAGAGCVRRDEPRGVHLFGHSGFAGEVEYSAPTPGNLDSQACARLSSECDALTMTESHPAGCTSSVMSWDAVPEVCWLQVRRARERVSVEAQNDSPLLRTHLRDRAEGKSAAPLRQQSVPANEDLVGMVGVALVANVVKPADGRAVARQNPVALGGGKQATKFRLPPEALLGSLISDPLLHAQGSVIRIAVTSATRPASGRSPI